MRSPRNWTRTEKAPLKTFESKVTFQLILCSLETKLYSETHTKNLLTEEKKKINAELTVKKNKNAQNDRVIKQAKHFTGKRDKIHKEMKDAHDKNAEAIEVLSKEIADMAWIKDKEERRLSDKQILAKQKAITTALTTESE